LVQFCDDFEWSDCLLELNLVPTKKQQSICCFFVILLMLKLWFLLFSSFQIQVK
jgi:hypothetical protein